MCPAQPSAEKDTSVVKLYLHPSFTRRKFGLRTAGALGAVAALSVGFARPAAAEQVLGDPAAPVEMREYSSLSCPHCASFHRETLPELKAKYIDTGKVKLVFRDFPLNLQAWIASGVAHCGGDERFFPLLETFFAEQGRWAAAPATAEAQARIAESGLMENWRAAGRTDQEVSSLLQVSGTITSLIDLAKFGGLSEEDAYACLADFELLDQVLASRQEGVTDYNVQSTPTFVIDGEVVSGALSAADFSAIIDAALDE